MRLTYFSATSAILLWLLADVAMPAQNATVSATVTVEHAGRHGLSESDNVNVVVWLKPLDAPGLMAASSHQYRMAQRNKQFEPHVLVVPVGAAVQFPNFDPFFHNVFSLYKGKRFDLGLYEAGSSRIVHFDRPGVSFVFCNIHSEMSAYIIAVDSPYFAISDARGHLTISNVPAGRYRLEVWYERADHNTLAKLARETIIAAPTAFLGNIEVVESEHFVPPHTNKHGEPYDPYPDSY